MKKNDKKIKSRSLEATRSKYGYFFTSPFIVGAVISVIYPVILSIVYSFCDVNANASGGSMLDFVGFYNYNRIFFKIPEYNETLVSTLLSTITDVPVVVIFSFFLASVLNTEFKGRGFARTMLFLPMILNSDLVTSILRRDHLDESILDKSSAQVGQFSGAFAQFLEQLGISSGVTNLLTSSVDNISHILAMSVIPIIVMLAGLQSVPNSVYEASYVEGATKWEVFWKISLPIVSPMILVSVVYCIIDSFTSIDNELIAMVEDKCFQSLELGEGSAMAWGYLLVVIILVAIVFLIVNRFVTYSD